MFLLQYVGNKVYVLALAIVKYGVNFLRILQEMFSINFLLWIFFPFYKKSLFHV